MKKSGLALILIVFVAGFCFAAGHSTPEQAKALLDKAVAHFKEVGRKQALVDFTGKKDPWVNGDLYVSCQDSKHIIQANGAFPNVVGTSTDAWKDDSGTPVGKAIWDAVSKDPDGTTSVNYKWYNPVSGKMEPKTLFSRKVDSDLVCGVGVYTQ